MNECIVMVHGHAAKPAADALHAFWRDALVSGLQRDCPELVERFQSIETKLVYFGDLNASVSDISDYDAQLDLADRRNALTRLQQYSKPKKFNRYNYEQLPGKSALGELVADVSAPLLGKLGLANIVVARIIPELAHYWDVSSQFYQQASSRMLQTLQSVLSNDSRVMTIAHGLGGVIAYDALWHLSQGTAGAGGLREHKVDRFITLGTPLADDTVRGRLAGQDEVAAQRYPCNIVNWYNVAAEDDYLCHDKTVADDFSAMLAQHVISLIEDFRIYNLSVRYGKSNPHSAVGYLAHPRMTRLLVDWLR